GRGRGAAGVRRREERVARLRRGGTREAVRRAHLAILVLDRSDPREEEDRAALAMIGDRPVVVAWNKADLVEASGSAGNGGGVATRPAAAEIAVLPALEVPRTQLLGEVATVAVRSGGAEALREALRASLRRLSGS